MLAVNQRSTGGRSRCELPCQGTGVEAPVLVPLPGGVLELVLDVEQPDAERRGQPGDRRLDQQEARASPTSAAAAVATARDREVGRQDARATRPRSAVRRRRGQPVLEDEDVDRPDAEHHERVPRQPVEQALPSAGRPRNSATVSVSDVADAAPVEIAAGGVVDGVAPAANGRRRSGSARRSRGRASRWPSGDGRTSRGRNRAGS